MLRKQFSLEVRARLRLLKQALYQLIVVEDAFGIAKQSQNPFTANTRWKFNTTDEQVEAFRQWLAPQIKIKTGIGSSPGDSQKWWEKYIKKAYDKGAGRAYTDTTKGKVKVTSPLGKPTQFNTVGSTNTLEKIKLISGRTFNDLKGVTDDMAMKITRELTDGLAKGLNPKVIAKNLADKVDISESRALTIARTEITRAHAEGQLDAFKSLGVAELGVAAEWNTAGDGNVCKLCAPLDGIVVKIEEATGMLPRHANCRCAWIPANTGEDKKDQVRSKTQIEKAIDKSIKAEIPPKSKRSLKTQKKQTSWAGADAKIAKKRPEDAVDALIDKFSQPTPKLKTVTPKQMAKKVAQKNLKPGSTPKKAKTKSKLTRGKAAPKKKKAKKK